MIDSPIATNHFLGYLQDIQKLGETDSKEILIKKLITRKAFQTDLTTKGNSWKQIIHHHWNQLTSVETLQHPSETCIIECYCF